MAHIRRVVTLILSFLLNFNFVSWLTWGLRKTRTKTKGVAGGHALISRSELYAVFSGGFEAFKFCLF